VPTEAETEQAGEAARQEVAHQVVIEQERRTKRERDMEDQANGLHVLATVVSEKHNGTPDVNTDVTTDQDEESEYDSDDEDWDSDDDDNDDNDDDDESSVNEPKYRRRRQVCKLAKGTPFDEYMEKVKRSLLYGEDKQHVLNGQHEFPPRKDPMVKSYNTNQTDWYESNYWIYAWFPFRQYGQSFHLTNFACIHCKEKELESHSYVYQPMFSFDKAYYCYHCRVQCKSCLKNFPKSIQDFFRSFRL